MDQSQVNELRAWARRLEEREGGHEEVRAAAKAILMLCDEVDALREKVDAAAAERPGPVVSAPATESEAAPAAEPAWEAMDDRTTGTFRSRIKRTFGLE
jgi:hypothetical protein